MQDHPTRSGRSEVHRKPIPCNMLISTLVTGNVGAPPEAHQDEHQANSHSSDGDGVWEKKVRLQPSPSRKERGVR